MRGSALWGELRERERERERHSRQGSDEPEGESGVQCDQIGQFIEL